MKYINMSIIYWFYKFLSFFEIKFVLISYSLSKVTSKAAETNGRMVW